MGWISLSLRIKKWWRSLFPPAHWVHWIKQGDINGDSGRYSTVEKWPVIKESHHNNSSRYDLTWTSFLFFFSMGKAKLWSEADYFVSNSYSRYINISLETERNGFPSSTWALACVKERKKYGSRKVERRTKIKDLQRLGWILHKNNPARLFFFLFLLLPKILFFASAQIQQLILWGC